MIHSILLFLVGLQPVCQDPAAPELASRVEEVIQTPGFEQGQWGLLVVDSKSGSVVYERNADRLFAPASVTKLFSCAAALRDLGADFRFQTPVVRRGAVTPDGKLVGDLILVARGDCSLGGRTGPDGSLLYENTDHSYATGDIRATLVNSDPLAGIDQLARDVAAAGIKEITGDILVDTRFFESAESTGSGPSRVSPIMVNDNVIDIEVRPGETTGAPARYRVVPSTGFAQVDFRVETTSAETPPRLTVATLGPRQLSVQGTIPVGHHPIVKIWEIDDPASFARGALIERLRERGVKVAASSLGSNDLRQLPSADEVEQLPKVAEYTSPPLSEYVRVILKVSQNLHASTLPLLMGAKAGTPNLSGGLRRAGVVLKDLGVPVETFSLGSGAGGSRADLVSPRATVSLLLAMMRQPEFTAFEAGLPVLGRDGTLSQAVDAESPARGRARAKTGTYTVDNPLSSTPILTSKSLAGYLETQDGRVLAFAFFVNNLPMGSRDHPGTLTTQKAGRLLGSLCEIFYSALSPSPRLQPMKGDASLSEPPL